jgi:PncC family amidohydrolase
VSYTNAAKVALLGVHPDTLAAHGAVSAETAREMARGALARLDADRAVSVTGIAGPGGGSEEKPVGLVFIGVAGRLGIEVAEHRFTGDRRQIRAASVMAALAAALAAVLDIPKSA